MDKVTQENASTSSQIDNLSSKVSELSSRLINITSTAQLSKNVHQQVCDIELVQTIAKYKNDHINFKDDNFNKLDSLKEWEVQTCDSCKMGHWIDESEANNKIYTTSNQWQQLKDIHLSLHDDLQEYIIKNAKQESNETLQTSANLIEEHTLQLFKYLDDILLENYELTR